MTFMCIENLGVEFINTATANSFEGAYRPIKVNSTNDEFLHTENRQLDAVKSVGGASKSCVAAVQAEGNSGSGRSEDEYPPARVSVLV